MSKVIACALATALGAGSAAADVAGYVLALQGKWLVQGQPAGLAVGSPVEQGARLAPVSPQAGDHIVVVEARSGAVLVNRRCDATPACAARITVAADRRRQKAALEQFVERVLARLAGEPDRYIATLSRGSAGLGDAVLPWLDGDVDLAPMLAALPAAGRYSVRLTTLHCRAGGACPQRPLVSSLGSSPSGQRMSTVTGLGPGLYEIVVTRPPGSVGPDQAHGWLLVVPAAERERADAVHRAGLGIVEAWGADVDASTRRGFTRALLDALVDS
ncbi:MAG: hypothetical protein ABI699_04455 [Caldimonas sp.]